MFTVGPYRYTATDAARTLSLAETWWELLTTGLEADDLESLREHLVETVRGIGPLSPDALIGHHSGTVADALGSVLQDLCTAAATLRGSGRLPTSATGTVDALHRSSGGVPKQAVGEVEVDFSGVVGDVQKTRVHHGRPWQALCLWSSEVIATFAAQGHPVRPGGAGENVTIGGLDWSAVRPGLRLRIGTVVCETAPWALPCKKTAFNFTGGDFELMHHERGPVSRIYATVTEPGTVRRGDPVELIG